MISQRFTCAMLVAANVALSRKQATEVWRAPFCLTPHPHFCFFNIQTSRRSLWSHKGFINLVFTYAAVVELSIN